MKSMKSVLGALLGVYGLTGFAHAQVTVCESDLYDTPAQLEFRPFSAGRSEALVMEYQGKGVMADPLSIFNHMGLILFRGVGGIEFHASEHSDEFYVTVSAFGGHPLVTARGKCRLKE